MKRFSTFGLVFFLFLAFAPFVSADLTDGFREGWDLTSNASNVFGNVTLTTGGSPTYTSTGAQFLGSPDSLYLDGGSRIFDLTKFRASWGRSVFCTWNSTSSTVQTCIGEQSSSGSARANLELTKLANNTIYVRVFDTGVKDFFIHDITANSEYHYVINYNGARIEIFVDTILKINSTLTINQFSNSQSGGIGIGNFRQNLVSGGYLTGKVRNFYNWNTPLNYSSIVELSTGIQYPFTPVTPNATAGDILAYDITNSDFLQNFTITFPNATQISTTNGTITYEWNLSNLHNFTINAFGFYNESYTQVNMSEVFQANLTQWRSIGARDIYTNTTIQLTRLGQNATFVINTGLSTSYKSFGGFSEANLVGSSSFTEIPDSCLEGELLLKRESNLLQLKKILCYDYSTLSDYSLYEYTFLGDESINLIGTPKGVSASDGNIYSSSGIENSDSNKIYVETYTTNTEFNITEKGYFLYQNESDLSKTGSSFVADLTRLPLEDFEFTNVDNTFINNSYTIQWTESISPSGKVVDYNVLLYNGTSYIVNTTTSNLNYTFVTTALNSNTFNVSIIARETGTPQTNTISSNLYLNKINELTFRDAITNTSLVNGNVTIVFPTGTQIDYTTDSLGKVQFPSFENTTLLTGNYTITFRDFSGYVTPITFTPTFSALPINQTYNISVTSITINIYYRSTGAPFTLLTNVIFQGLFNQNTSNGSIFIQNTTISTGSFIVQAQSEGYGIEQKQIKYNDQQNLNIDFYMQELNATTTATITAQTLDEFQRLQAGVRVQLQEYNLISRSYVEVSECYTQDDGKCKLVIELNTKTYKLIASKQINGQIFTAETEPQVFTSDISGGESIIFTERIVPLLLRVSANYLLNPVNNLNYVITESFNNQTNRSTITTTFSTLDGTTRTLCLEYFELESGRLISLTGETYCLTGSSGTITPTTGFLLNRSKDYVAQVYIKDNGGKIILETFNYKSTSSLQDLLQNFNYLPSIILFLWIAIIGVGISFKNVPLTGILIIIGTWLIFFNFPSIALGSISVLQTVIGVSLLYLGRKKEDFE